MAHQASTSDRLLETQAPGTRRWTCSLLRVLLISSTLYGLLMLSWSANNFELMGAGLGSGEGSRGSNRSRTPFLKLTTVQANNAPSGLSNNETGSLPSSGSFRSSDSSNSKTVVVELKAEAPEVLPVDLPSNETTERRFNCIGFRATSGCRSNGPRLPAKDQSCATAIPDGISGFCEVEDLDSGERFKVMKRSCAKSKIGAKFLCSEASGFANFPVQAQKAVERALEPDFALPNARNNLKEPRQGIVMVVYPKLLASAYATIRVLRDVLGCQLPIEIWFRPDEFRKVPGALEPLQELAQNDNEGGISFREIDNPRAVRFGAKVHAVYNSVFDHVLFLDADNVPVRDPSFLFKTPEFMKSGAIFWPDFWHPQHTIFHVHAESLVWELLDMPFVDMFEQESGQLAIDRRRHAAPLELVTFYAFHRPSHFDRLKLVWGDKDLFRLAWLKLDAPFHMIQAPPATAGKLIDASFCGMTMVQHDAQGNVLFLHRNQLKLTGERDSRIGDSPKKADALDAPQPDGYPDPAIWTHLMSFRNTSSLSEYVIHGYRATPVFPDWQKCFGRRYVSRNPHFYVQKVADLGFAGLETHLRRFAMEGARLGQAAISNRSG